MKVRFRLLTNSKKLFNDCKWSDMLCECTEDSLEEMLMSVYMALNSVEGVRINYTSDNITVYGNDLDIVNEFKKHCLEKCVMKIVEANDNMPRGTIYRKHSSYKYRIILKRRTDELLSKNDLLSFVNTYKEYIKISKGFDWWLFHTRFSTVKSEYYFDTNEESISEMFDLVAPGLRSKTVRIISDKYKTEET